VIILAGFVYIMSNPAFPDLIKIGMSKKDPTKDRVSELNQTGVPQPFKVEYYAYVEDESLLERLLHQKFEDERPNKNREFFSTNPAIVINALKELASIHSPIKYEEIYFLTPEELEIARKNQEAIDQEEWNKIEVERQNRIAAKQERITQEIKIKKDKEALELRYKKRDKRNGVIWYFFLSCINLYILAADNPLTLHLFLTSQLTTIYYWIISALVYWYFLIKK
jgi:hypothetical protein